MTEDVTPSTRSSPGWKRFGAYVKGQREERDITGEQMAELLNTVTRRARPYGQGHVAAYEQGRRMYPEVVRDYVFALNLNRFEVSAVLLGDDFNPIDRALAFYSLIDSMPELDDETKGHIKRQYGMLRETVAHRRGLPFIEIIESDDGDDDDNRYERENT